MEGTSACAPNLHSSLDPGSEAPGNTAEGCGGSRLVWGDSVLPVLFIAANCGFCFNIIFLFRASKTCLSDTLERGCSFFSATTVVL